MTQNIAEELRDMADRIEQKGPGGGQPGRVVVDFEYSYGPRVTLRQDSNRLYVEQDGEEFGYIYLNQLRHVANGEG